MTALEDVTFPSPSPPTDSIGLHLRWLDFLRGAVLRKALGVTDEQARWRPDGKLLPLVGLVNHLTNVERRWIDGVMLGGSTFKDPLEYEAPALPIDVVITAYRERAVATAGAVRSLGDLDTRSPGGEYDLRFVLLHLINETARHAGHADAVRELLDGTVGE
ncbi:mycothiol transferase [Paractinoplanes atraurantiacus]|uniref:DinB superfamily protein n=1 Tax=Paractinoplanes atraurantiacus TaxID=1036182 RepID=A0A285J7S4_9ACTN|nr:DUF664 domain-containing protein [Actinoplanes atraurantiacus]SNY56390.1 Protein of unknown function [Actinoplanes atraurantiacus]